MALPVLGCGNQGEAFFAWQALGLKKIMQSNFDISNSQIRNPCLRSVESNI
jgi:hypothetical protein